MLAPLRLASDLLRLRRTTGVPLVQGLQDILTFRKRIRATRADFFWYRLHDRSRPLADRLTYLSRADRYRIEYLMNPRAASRRLLDKCSVTTILDAAGVATPPCLGVFVPAGSSYAHGPQFRTEAELRELLARPLPDGLVCKPNGGSAGVDVLVFKEATPSGLTQLDGTPWSVDALYQRLCRAGRAASPEDHDGIWKLEPRVVQHPDLTALVGPTLATARVVAFRSANGVVHLLPPIWKVPISDCGVDNLNFSGWVCPVDTETGQLGAMVHRDTRERRATHPITGARIEGTRLPGWERVADLVRAATAPFPELRSLGCDIGFTEAGPVVIEINPWWGCVMMQVPHELGIVRGEFASFLQEIGANWVVAGRDA
jgi:hypothetical protein